jgi:hypothetical protein
LYRVAKFNNNSKQYSDEIEERPKTINLFLKNLVTLKTKLTDLCTWLDRENQWELDVKEKQEQEALKIKNFKTETVEALTIAFPNGRYIEHKNYYYSDENNSLCIHVKDDTIKIEVYNTKLSVSQSLKLAKVMQLVIEE